MAPPRANEVFYADQYHPIQAGSIDGTDVAPHDHGITRALIASSSGIYDPTGDPKAVGDPYCTIFLGRLSRSTTEETLQNVMSKYGKIKSLRLVRHIVTGASRGYAFVEFENEKDYMCAYEAAHHINIDGSQVIVDFNRQQLMSGWIPRRFGGGLGGRKESGQLRFGGRERPFRAPLKVDDERLKELKEHGLPLPPAGHYVSRYQVPAPPKRRKTEGSHSRTYPSDEDHHHRHEEQDSRHYPGDGGHHIRQRHHSRHDEEGRHDEQERNRRHYSGEGHRFRHSSRNEQQQHGYHSNKCSPGTNATVYGETRSTDFRKFTNSHDYSEKRYDEQGTDNVHKQQKKHHRRRLDEDVPRGRGLRKFE